MRRDLSISEFALFVPAGGDATAYFAPGRVEFEYADGSRLPVRRGASRRLQKHANGTYALTLPDQSTFAFSTTGRLHTAAQIEAQAAGLGIWGGPSDSPVEISRLHPNAEGNDNFNLSDEWVGSRVLVAGTLRGYSVEDDSGHQYQSPTGLRRRPVRQAPHRLSSDTQADLYGGHDGQRGLEQRRGHSRRCWTRKDMC